MKKFPLTLLFQEYLIPLRKTIDFKSNFKKVSKPVVTKFLGNSFLNTISF